MISRKSVGAISAMLATVLSIQAAGVGQTLAAQATPAATAAAAASGSANPFDPTTLRELSGKLATAVQGTDPSKYKLALVVNVLSSFWTAAAIGEQRASSELNVPVVFEAPDKAGDVASQQSVIESLVTDQYSGVSFSAIDPASVVDIVNKGITSGTNFIMMDSDSPNSNRAVYIGVNNYNAGMLAGKAMITALGSNCGKVVGFVGFITAQNAIDRIQGIKDSFKGTSCTLETVLVDNADPTKAESNAETALTTYPDLAGMIGIYSYNGPSAVQALKAAGKVGKVKLVSFDLEPGTLQGLKDGVVSAAIGQRVYFYGYLSVYILYAMSALGKDKAMAVLAPYLSGDKKDALDTGADVVTPDTLTTYQAYLNSIGIKSQ